RPNAIEPSELVVSNAINRAVLAVMPLGAPLRGKFSAPYLVCLRADLHRALATVAAAHPGIELHYGTHLSDFAAHGSGVAAKVERNGQTEEIVGAALIGADGIRSQTRARLHPGTAP